jgi:hypothetical protein
VSSGGSHWSCSPPASRLTQGKTRLGLYAPRWTGFSPVGTSRSRKRMCRTSGLTRGRWMAFIRLRRRRRCGAIKPDMACQCRACWITRPACSCFLDGLPTRHAIATADRRVGVLRHALGGADRLLEGTAPLTAKPIDVPIGVPHRRRCAARIELESSPPTRRPLSTEWLQGEHGGVEGDRAWPNRLGDVHRRTGTPGSAGMAFDRTAVHPHESALAARDVRRAGRL